ncbi:MAG: hypothetical protein A3J79_11925 [Elusimicrobia bacterium RIFOXYB2_FULL_62_6]|nr:MAG: hypothetical protein A3J79_11925 [Elusimicrobia bacterium RIFOXYB2_FULL_62_6]
MLVTAFAAFTMGAFLLVVHIGAANRQLPRNNYKSVLRHTPPQQETGIMADFKRGSVTVQKKAESLLDSMFDWSAAVPSSSAGTAAAQRGANGNSAEPADAFEKFYQENYAGKFEPGGEFYSGPDSGRSWVGPGGGNSFSGGGRSSQGSSSAQLPVKTAAKSPAAAAAPPVASKPDDAPRSVFGGPVSAGKGRNAAPPPLFASNPPRNDKPAPGKTSGSPAGYGGGSSSFGGSPAHRPGGMSGMSGGGVSDPDLGGATEKMQAGAKSNYDAKMSGGAGAAAAAGAAPEVSAANAVGGGKGGGKGGGESGGGDSGGAASSPKAAPAKGDTAASAPAAAKTAPASSYVPASYSSAPAEEEDLLKSVVSEKLNGKDAKYLADDDDKRSSAPDGMLKAGATEGDSTEKGVAISTEAEPDNLANLSPENKTALKKRVHRFLKRVEKKYGPMQDITCTKCTATPEVCKEKDLKGSYLTMKTAQSAELVISLKYSKKKWRLHTVDFKDPSAAPGKPHK